MEKAEQFIYIFTLNQLNRKHLPCSLSCRLCFHGLPHQTGSPNANDVAPSNCRNTPTPNPRCLSVHRQLRSIHYLVSNNDAGDMIPNSKSCLYFQFHPIWECLCQTGDAYTPAVFMYKALGFWPRVVVEDPAWQKTCHLKPETSLRNTRATSVSLYPILPFQLSLEEPSSHEAQREFHLLLIGCLFPVLNCLRHVCGHCTALPQFTLHSSALKFLRTT